MRHIRGWSKTWQEKKSLFLTTLGSGFGSSQEYLRRIHISRDYAYGENETIADNRAEQVPKQWVVAIKSSGPIPSRPDSVDLQPGRRLLIGKLGIHVPWRRQI